MQIQITSAVLFISFSNANTNNKCWSLVQGLIIVVNITRHQRNYQCVFLNTRKKAFTHIIRIHVINACNMIHSSKHMCKRKIISN